MGWRESHIEGETISVSEQSKEQHTPILCTFFLLVCVYACVCGGAGALTVMCLTDIEDNCALSSSCLCNSTAAAA